MKPAAPRVSSGPEIEADLADAKHRDALDARLQAAVDAGTETWADLLAASHGADPRLVAHRVQARGLPITDLAPPSSAPVESSWTPELHALDFEWYFSARCAEWLAAEVARTSRRVLCLGCPTVAHALLAHPRLTRVTLVDRNPLVRQRLGDPEALHTIAEDLDAAHLEAGRYDTVVFDAPWYPAALAHWLAVAAAAVRPGGRILFALMGALHRPSAVADRASIVRMAERCGPVTIDEGRLRYESPRFEREALATAGVATPAHWRRADLVQVTVMHDTDALPVAPAPVSRPWSRFVIGPQVIHLDPDATNEVGDILAPVALRNDFRYASISTRDPRRARIGLWTSRSRVARVRRPQLVAALLERLAATGQLRSLRGHPALATLDDTAQARLFAALRHLLGLS
ncbi:MAG: hypothetical protein AAF799_23820 [Myxococcota bacterium]